MNIPLNRWTLLAGAAIAALLGPDFLSALTRVFLAATASYVPAM